MSQEQSDGENGVVETEVGPVDDETAETEMDFRPPRGSDWMPGIGQSSREPSERRRTSVIQDRHADSGPWAEPNQNDPGMSCQFRKLRDHAGCCREPGQPEESVTNRFSLEMPTPTYPRPGRQPPGAGTQPVIDRYACAMPTTTYPGPARQPPVTGTQPATDRFAYELPPRTRTQSGLDRLRDDLPDMPNSVSGHDKLPPRTEVHDFNRSPEANLMDTVGAPTFGG